MVPAFDPPEELTIQTAPPFAGHVVVLKAIVDRVLAQELSVAPEKLELLGQIARHEESGNRFSGTGTWKPLNGTGRFANLRGGGSFRWRMDGDSYRAEYPPDG